MGPGRPILGILVSVVVSVTAGPPAHSAQVADLDAHHHDGQTFLVWRVPPGAGPWTFRVYASSSPITGAADLADSVRVAMVRDSAWYDRVLSVQRGTVSGFVVDSGGPPLDASRSLSVVTAEADRARYYAVTAQQGTGPEDLGVTPGSNALPAPVEEHVGTPRPIHQRTVDLGTFAVEVYTLWTHDRSTPCFPAMANLPGMPFDCAVYRGGSAPPYNALFVHPHHGGGNFLTSVHPVAGNWSLAVDDNLPDGLQTFWYGYHEDFDCYLRVNPLWDHGLVHDYTLRRVFHTVMWARRNFPVDTTRVYTTGGSMGAIGALVFAFHRPDLFAGVVAAAGKVDFGFLDEPDPEAAFNPDGPLRDIVDRFWGPVAADLPSSDGYRVYQSLDDGFLASVHRRAGLPPVVMFDGRHDTWVGWAEKIGFYAAMRENRQGGRFFWDQRSHGYDWPRAWQPMVNEHELLRYRTDLSYPALSSCAADDDPGDGTLASGDTVGCINGFVDWDTALVDTPDRWEVALSLRDLRTLWGPVAAPDSTTVEVTPRRVQRFRIGAGGLFDYTVTRTADGALLRSGTVAADSLGLLTVCGVPVPRTGSRLRIEPSAALGVPAPWPRGPSLALSGAHPVTGGARFRFGLPGRTHAVLSLHDVAGRRVATLADGEYEAGEHVAVWDRASRSGCSAGLYFARLVAGGHARTLRVVVLE